MEGGETKKKTLRNEALLMGCYIYLRTLMIKRLYVEAHFLDGLLNAALVYALSSETVFAAVEPSTVLSKATWATTQQQVLFCFLCE
jgi:hypothetical protein